MLNGADFVAIILWYHENYVVMQRVMLLTQLWAHDDVLDQMRRVMASTISALLIALFAYPALVHAAGLSRPIILPPVLVTEEEQRAVFAINDSGEAVVAHPF